ncbi:MAG: hypothetical protein IPK06_04325 [Ignavibacteriae bacterium]|nr:hypothetical protein [Ignavibacteriota bacterium]
MKSFCRQIQIQPDLGILTANYIDFNFTVHNINALDTLDMHAWLNLQTPFYLTSFPSGWYIFPGDSGIFGMRIDHLGVDTVYSVNVGFVASNIADTYRDTLWHTFVVDMQTTSNTLLALKNLTAESNNSGIYLSWQDPNVQDTTVVYDLNFLISSDVNLFTPNSSAAILSYDVGRMKITNNNVYSAWNSAKIEIPVISGQRYEIKSDYVQGTANTGWLVVYDKLNSALKLTTQSSISNTTFTYSFTSNFTGTAVVLLQINADVLGEYAFFDNFSIRQTEPSYDYIAIERQPYYLGYPNGNFSEIFRSSNAITSYLDNSATVNEQYNYRLKISKNDYAIYSNSDTATYKILDETPVSDLHNIYADVYVKNGGSTNWANRSDSTTGITIETLLSNISSLGTNKIIAFKSGDYFLKAFKLNGSAYDNFTFTTYGGSKRAKIGLYAELPGWNNSANWVSQGAKDGGYLWKFDFTGKAQAPYSLQRLYLNDVEYYSRANIEKYLVSPTYYQSLGTVDATGGQAPELLQDSVWAHYSAIYPWTKDVWQNNQALQLLLWTPTNTNPANYYYSIKQVSYNSADPEWSGLIEFENIDNLTLDFLEFEGGEFGTIFLIKTNNVLFKNCILNKPQYASIRCYEVSESHFLNNDFIGYDQLPEGTIIADEGSARDGIGLFYNSDNNVVRGNRFYNYSTQSINVSAILPTQQAASGYDTGVPENNIIDSNFVINTIGRRYARPFQVSCNEVAFPNWVTNTSYSAGTIVTNSSAAYRCLVSHTSGTFSTDLANGKWNYEGASLYNHTRMPINTYVTRNLFINMNVGAKDMGADLKYMYNVYVGDPDPFPKWIIDHGKVYAANNSSVFETIGDTTNSLRLYLNNTFVNVRSGLSYSGSDYGFITSNYAYENNLFLNMATSRKFNIRSYTPTIYVNSDLDFRWYRNRTKASIKNNLSFNSNLTDTGDRLGYKLDESSSNTYTYAEFATFLTGDANRTVSGNIVLSNATYNLNSILPNWQNSDYKINTSSPAHNAGIDITNYLPNWLTKDYFGNVINKTQPNIGAVDN